MQCPRCGCGARDVAAANGGEDGQRSAFDEMKNLT
jgi:hypothetical protein